MTAAPRLLVTLTADELQAIVRVEIEQALADRRTPPAVLTQDQLAESLGVSSRTIYTLRQEGLPTVLVGDSPRFDLGECLAWLRARKGKAA